MEKVENIVEFYQRKFDRIPEDIYNEIGHLDVFRLEPFVGGKNPFKTQCLECI